MAVSRTLVRATQYRLIYSIQHDGGAGDTLTITNAQLLADAGSFPRMQELLNTVVADSTAAALLMVGIPGRTYIIPTDDGNAPQPWSVDWTESGNRVQCVIRGTAGVVSEAILEIQRVHTFDQ